MITIHFNTTSQALGNSCDFLCCTILKELYFCQFFEVDKAQVKHVESDLIVYTIKFVSCRVHANLTFIIFKGLKPQLSARANSLINNCYMFKSLGKIQVVDSFMKLKCLLVQHYLSGGAFFLEFV